MTRRRASRPRGRDDAHAGELGRGRAQARRRDRTGLPVISSPMAKRRIYRLPVIRGIVALGESLAIGFRALAISANYAAQPGGRGRRGRGAVRARSRPADLRLRDRDRLHDRAVQGRPGPDHEPARSRLDAGVRRRRGADPRQHLHPLPVPDLAPARSPAAVPVPRCRAQGDQRLRGRRGAEPERVQRFSLIHPRCGTAFLLWVMVIAIFVFAFFGRPHWYWLIASRSCCSR